MCVCLKEREKGKGCIPVVCERGTELERKKECVHLVCVRERGNMSECGV